MPRINHLTPLLSFVLCSLCILLLGCKDDDCTDATNPECPNYDYCQTFEDLSPDFETFIANYRAPFGDSKIYELSMVVRDTTFGGNLSFRALDESADTYAWNFGNDPRTNYGKETNLLFNPANVSGKVEIDLNVYREVERCPERGAEHGSKTETIYIIGENPDFDVQPILGTFIGNNESEIDMPDFEITFFYDEETQDIRLKAFPRGAVNGVRLNNPIINNNYKEFLLMPTANKCCSRAHGVGQLSDDKQDLRIEYKVFNFDTEEWIDKVWTGTREKD